MESNLYTYIAAEKKYVCNECGKTFCSTVSSVRKHCQTVHKLNYKRALNESTTDEGDNVEPQGKKSKLVTLQTSLSKNEFVKCCIGIVAVNSMPFRILDDERFFKVLIEPYEKQFGTNINSRSIGNFMANSCSKIRMILKERLNNKLVSIKVDIATRKEKNILGINVQYVRNFKICVNTLGMIQLKKTHTSIHLRDVIKACLNDYGIELKQVYTNTTDNGANVVKASRLLQALQEDSLAESSFDMDSEPLDDDEGLHAKIASVMTVVRCAAHTIQLAAKDVLNTLQPQIKICRDAVKKLRRSIRRRDSDQHMPVLDNTTRWNTTYDMLTSLANIKDLINNQSFAEEYNIIDWEFIAEFTSAYEPLAICTKNLQHEQYIVGDFYRDWRLCEIELQLRSTTTQYALPLLNAMLTRKETLLENDAFLAALYLDPRYNFEGALALTPEQNIIGLNHLMKTYDAITRIERGCHTESSVEVQSSGCSTVDSMDVPTRTAEQILDELIGDPHCTSLPTLNKRQKIREKLLHLSQGKKEPLNSKILEYWKTKVGDDDDMKKLVEVVLAVPSTQVSVERAFNALALVLTKLRTRMSDTTINNVFLTRLNFELIQPIDIDITE